MKKLKKIIFYFISLVCGLMQTLFIVDYLMRGTSKSMLEATAAPSAISFGVMLVCGKFSREFKKPWINYFIVSSLPMFVITFLSFIIILPLSVLPILAITVGGGTYLGTKMRDME
ncbi:MAG: hypothetical protein OEV42_14065 [Deltaproteobacteria bacterium]|nr:hypothetical protein [Deltaproteobacteria bacterium]